MIHESTKNGMNSIVAKFSDKMHSYVRNATNNWWFNKHRRICSTPQRIDRILRRYQDMIGYHEEIDYTPENWKITDRTGIAIVWTDKRGQMWSVEYSSIHFDWNDLEMAKSIRLNKKSLTFDSELDWRENYMESEDYYRQ